KKNQPVFTKLGDCFSQIGEKHKAQMYYRRAIEQVGVSAQVYVNLARLVLETDGDPAEAEEFLQTAIEANPDDFSLRCELVHLLLKNGKISDAKEQLEHADRTINKDDAEQARNLANARSAIAAVSTPEL
ncbi:MAG: tetratricopeptide repeat protein, partial [Pseudomonadota bacterium]